MKTDRKLHARTRTHISIRIHSMNTHTRALPRIIALLALAGAAFATTGCTTPAGQKARQSVQETNSTLDGVDSATNTANRAADTARKVSDTIDRFFKQPREAPRQYQYHHYQGQTAKPAVSRAATARFRGGGKNNFSNPHTQHIMKIELNPKELVSFEKVISPRRPSSWSSSPRSPSGSSTHLSISSATASPATPSWTS
jgi:hypothetical protein